jgi:hypothetical protein
LPGIFASLFTTTSTIRPSASIQSGRIAATLSDVSAHAGFFGCSIGCATTTGGGGVCTTIVPPESAAFCTAATRSASTGGVDAAEPRRAVVPLTSMPRRHRRR